MMNKYIIAAAGSGKTTYLVKEALKIKNGNVLITTFTDANRDEIIKKICELNKGFIPSNIVVKTWFTFLLYDGVKPYQNVIYELRLNGIELVNSKSGIHYYMKNKIPVFYPESEAKKYYFTNTNKMYSDKISKFVIRVDDYTNGKIINRLEKIYNNIFIDEVQDLAGYDLELLKKLFNSTINIIMAGDPRQVTFHTHEESKYGKYSKGNIDEFIINECKNIDVNIDNLTLNKSYRNNQEICDYAFKLYSNFPKCDSLNHEITGHDGIFYICKDEIKEYIDKYSPMQLRDKSNSKGIISNYPVMNFGNCKGLTFDRVIIFPTNPILTWLTDNNNELPERSKSKLYVAITRAKYSVAFVVPNNFNVSNQ